MPSLESVINGWIAHFWSADHAMEWLAAEVEHLIWLTPNTLLVGRLDAIGRDANGDLFFGEWKTSSTRVRKTWKATWRMNPQSLTYGVLANSTASGCAAGVGGPRRFTVRMAFKTDPPTFDHAWYAYQPSELAHWCGELVRIADEIRGYKRGYAFVQIAPWPTNFSACFRYGPEYACPFFEFACSKLDWNGLPAGILPGEKRVPHLELERRSNEGERHPNGTIVGQVAPDIVVLDATRVQAWLDCRERFRRQYIENCATPTTAALQFGIDAHAGWGEYYKSLIKQEAANG